MAKSNLFYKFFKFYLDKKMNKMFNITVKNAEYFDSNQTYYIIANHTSWIDPFLILYALPKKLTISIVIEESSAFTRGLISRVANIVNIDYIKVNRADKKSRLLSLRKVINEVKKGQTVLVFPEGRINPNSNRLYPFYKGGFLAATSNEVEILPIKIKGAEKLYDGRNISIEFGEPIPTSKRDNLDNVAIHAFNTLRDEMLVGEIANDESVCVNDITMKYLTELAPPPLNLGEPIADPKNVTSLYKGVNDLADQK